MATLIDLGKRVKEQYPGSYDDMSDIDLGRKIQQKFPGAYDDYTEPPGAGGFFPGPQPPTPAQQDVAGSVMLNPPAPMHERILRYARHFTGRVGLPVAGSVTGAAIGERYGGEPGRYLGQGLGGMTGEALAQWAYGEPLNLTQIGAAGVTPAAARGTTAGVGRLLPGSGIARLGEIQSTVEQRIPTIIAGEATPEQVTHLFGVAHGQGARIPLRASRQAALSVLEREAQAGPALQFSRVGRIAQEFDELGQAAAGGEVRDVVLSPIVDAQGRQILSEQVVRVTPARDGTLPLEVLDIKRQRIGALIGVTQNAAELGELKQLYAGIMTDIEAAAAAGVPGAGALREGIRMQRRLFALETWDREMDTAIGRPRPSDNLQPINTGKLLREVQKIRQGRPSPRFSLFADSLSPGDLREIETLLERMNKLNVKLMPPAGTQFGSGINLIRGGAVGGALSLAGADLETAAAVGALSNAAAYAMSRFLLTPWGRTFLHSLLDQSATLNAWQIVAEFAAQQQREYWLRGALQEPPATATPTPFERFERPVSE